MKIVILGDTHFGVRSDSLDFHNYFKKFYENYFFPFLEKENIKTVVQMGDLFDRRKYINYNTLKLARNYFFDPLKENGIQLYTLLGNHDIFYKNTLDVNSPELLLKEYDNINIINEITTITFDGIDIDFVPWICDENEEQISNFIKSSKSQICFGHFEISGFEMDKGHVCDSGMDSKKLSRYDVVLSGHFHHKSSLGNISYVGTPYEMTWTDYNDPKGIHIFNTSTREKQFFKNPYSMFHKIFYNDKEMESDYWSEFDFTQLSDSYVKVVVESKQNPYLFDVLIDSLYKNDVKDISIVEDFSDSDDVDEVIDQAEDTISILSKHIDSVNIDLNKEKLKTLMRRIYLESIDTETA